MNRSLGVDLGATWLRAALAEDGKIKRRWRIPAVRWTALAPELRKLKFGRLDRLTVGPTGVWNAADRRALALSLKTLSKRVRVISDVELAHEAAFGGGPGVLVIAGTGSIAYGRSARGKSARAGGLGAYLGDEGSGFWLGREALREPRLAKYFPESLALRLAHEPKPIRAIAGLAPTVLRLARKNSAASAIVARGASHLADCALRVRGDLRLAGKTPLVCHGTLFKDRIFQDAFQKRVSSRFSVTRAAYSADIAAAKK